MAASYADELRGFPRKSVSEDERHPWPFLRIEQPLYTRGESREVQERVERMLEVASQKAFKIWSLSTPLKMLSWVLRAGLVAGFIWLWVKRPGLALFQILPPEGLSVTIGWIGWTAFFALLAVVLSRVLGRFLGKAAMAILKWRDTLSKIVLGVVMATVGFLAARLHIHVFRQGASCQGQAEAGSEGVACRGAPEASVASSRTGQIKPSTARKENSVMTIYEQDGRKEARRVFISYSSIDRFRVNGLALLMEAMGHQVFHDHRTIKPGMRWQAALQEGLKSADAVLVFWTRHAAKSDWVRKEYEYFAAKHADRLLVPVLGDETPLSELLKTRQHADFAPVVNEVLAMQRKMKDEGAGAKAIENAVSKRLEEAGVEIKEKDKKWIFLFLGFGWLLTLLRHPGSSAQTAGRAVVEKTAQATVGQALVIATAALVGVAGAYPAALNLAETGLRQEVETLRHGNRRLRVENEQMSEGMEAGVCLSQDVLDRRLGDIASRLDDLAQCRQEIATLAREVGRLGEGVAPSPQQGLSRGETIGETEPSESAASESPRDGRAVDGNSVPQGQVEVPPIQFKPPVAGGAFVKPRLVFDPHPDYPRSAKRAGVEGVVGVRGVIDREGNVLVRTIETAPGPRQDALADAAQKAVGKWKFEPGTIDGEPIEVELTVTVKFDLGAEQ